MTKPTAPAVSVIIPVYEPGEFLDRCLQALTRSNFKDYECIVVDDGSSIPVDADNLLQYSATLIRLEHRSGPAKARNVGAGSANGAILFFIDVDVEVHPDALGTAVSSMQANTDISAVFGSYDESPDRPEFISRYRNLYHHWVHQNGNENASTFWSGLGAIRRDIFQELNGFDITFRHPSIEDIELGYRLKSAGGHISLLKNMRGKHLKHWTFSSILQTDLLKRGVPWVQLLLATSTTSTDLNLNWKSRFATICAALLVISIAGILLIEPLYMLPYFVFLLACVASRFLEEAGSASWKSLLSILLVICLPTAVFREIAGLPALLPLFLTLAIVGAQLDFYRLVTRLHGIGFAFAVIPMQILFFLLCALSVPLGIIKYQWAKMHRSSEQSGSG